MDPVEGVQAQPALPGQPVEIGPGGVINPDLLPGNYDPRIGAVADEALQAGDLCCLFNNGTERRIRRAICTSAPTLATVFVKQNCASGSVAAAYLTGALVIPNPGTFSAMDIGSVLFLSPTLPGYMQKEMPTVLGQLIQRVALVTDVTSTEVRCFFIGYLDRGRPSGSGIVDTDPLVTAHLIDVDNPHAATAAQVGAIPTTAKGAASGVAPLGSNSLVPDGYLPVSPWKALPVRIVCETNVNVAAPGGTLNGLNMGLDNRVLLVNQGTPSQNGIYLWKGATVPMLRATDADTGDKIFNSIWIVREGTNPNTGWACTNSTSPTLGTTNLTFVKLIYVPAPGWTNPMTTPGDMIVGGAAGEASRIAKGVDGNVMTMVFGLPTWAAPAVTGGAMINPMMAVGDIIVGTTGGEPISLSRGVNGMVLTMVGGTPTWIAPVTGMANPMTGQWDILVGGISGTPSRIGPGANGQILTMVGGQIAWAASALSNPMTSIGDIIIGGSSGVPSRLSPGANGQVLTMIAGSPGWTAPNTGFTSPMTSQWDLIVGLPGGAPGRLAKGADGQALTMVGGAIMWASGLTNPMTTASDLIIGGSGGIPARLAKGADGQVLTMVSGGAAWAAPVTGFINPMTALEDLIKGGAGGAPTRIPKGVDGNVLTMVGGVITWTAPVTGFINPMTTLGDIILGGISGAPGRLAKGADGQTLTMVTGVPGWATPPTGFINPMLSPSDLIIGGVAGAPGRLAKGAEGYVLTVVGGVTTWAAPVTGFINPMTTAEDLIKGGASGAPVRLAKGSDGQVFTMVGGVATWAAPVTGFINPMTASGDLIVGGTAGAPSRLAKGTDGQVLTLVAGHPAYADIPAGGGGMANPMTASGDLIVGGAAGAPGRLAKGADGKALILVAGQPAWSGDLSGGSSGPLLSITAPDQIDFTASGGHEVMPWWDNSGSCYSGPPFTASVELLPGATYVWEWSGGIVQPMSDLNSHEFSFIAGIYNSIKLGCTVTTTDGIVHQLQKDIEVVYPATWARTAGLPIVDGVVSVDGIIGAPDVHLMGSVGGSVWVEGLLYFGDGQCIRRFNPVDRSILTVSGVLLPRTAGHKGVYDLAFDATTNSLIEIYQDSDYAPRKIGRVSLTTFEASLITSEDLSAVSLLGVDTAGYILVACNDHESISQISGTTVTPVVHLSTVPGFPLTDIPTRVVTHIAWDQTAECFYISTCLNVDALPNPYVDQIWKLVLPNTLTLIAGTTDTVDPALAGLQPDYSPVHSKAILKHVQGMQVCSAGASSVLIFMDAYTLRAYSPLWGVHTLALNACMPNAYALRGEAEVSLAIDPAVTSGAWFSGDGLAEWKPGLWAAAFAADWYSGEPSYGTDIPEGFNLLVDETCPLIKNEGANALNPSKYYRAKTCTMFRSIGGVSSVRISIPPAFYQGTTDSRVYTDLGATVGQPGIDPSIFYGSTMSISDNSPSTFTLYVEAISSIWDLGPSGNRVCTMPWFAGTGGSSTMFATEVDFLGRPKNAPVVLDTGDVYITYDTQGLVSNVQEATIGGFRSDRYIRNQNGTTHYKVCTWSTNSAIGPVIAFKYTYDGAGRLTGILLCDPVQEHLI